MNREGRKARTIVKTGTFGEICATRFPELAYQRQIDTWRIIDVSTGANVGPQYRTRGELLADLDRFARVFGCA